MAIPNDKLADRGINATTRLVALLGWPVAHSLSPAMQNAGFVAEGLDLCYVAFAVPPEQLATAIRGLAALGARGANVTIPHKVTAVQCCDQISSTAEQAGAVNTLLFDDGRVLGDNTDVPGLLMAFGRADVELRSRRVVVLGAGGVARAALVALVRSGAASIGVVNRTPETAALLLDTLRAAEASVWGGSTAASRTRLSVLPWTAESLADADIIVGAIPPRSPLPLDAVAPHCYVMDLAYQAAGVTPLVAAARARGLRHADGKSMLVCQGALAFEQWTGCRAPIEIMSAALAATEVA